MAQAVADVASGVDMYISNASQDDIASTLRTRLSDTITWMVGEGVDIIVYSVTWSLKETIGDGLPRGENSLLSNIIAAVADDVLWVNAAGNQQLALWYGAFSDTNFPQDDYHDYSSGDDRNYIQSVVPALHNNVF